jgi:hypothetical protein
MKGLLEILQARNIKYTLWAINSTVNGESIDFSLAPPEGVFFNRMSCSSHTRGHHYAVGYTRLILQWLESYGRRVINGLGAFEQEVNKAFQAIRLGREGIRTPSTQPCMDTDSILDHAKAFDPVMIKDNLGGSGSGVFRFAGPDRISDIKQHLQDKTYPISPDGITLVQRYIGSSMNRIFRVEFIGGEFVYRLAVDTSRGFNLCPATSCEVENCPLSRGADETFRIVESSEQENEEDYLLQKYRAFAEKYKLEVCAFEYVVDAHGLAWTYDINCNTNYNLAAEKRWIERPGVSMEYGYAFSKLADYLEQQLHISNK